MRLTKEQKDIINAKEKSFKINAVAGSGKTTTLLEYAKKHKDLRILYLAYNKSLQTSILKKLAKENIKNMQVSTIHSLAYNKIGAYRYKLTSDLKTQTMENIIREFETKIHQHNLEFLSPSYLALLKDLVNFYCNSSLINLDINLLKQYKKSSDLGVKILDLVNKHSSSLLAHLKYILSAMKNGKIEATHDFYLKMFFLSKRLSCNLGYDLILVDEAQDISDVMIALVEAQSCHRIYVGDNFQQIYSFRYATNALDKINLPSYTLSKSFRFSNDYAKILEKKLNALYKGKKLKIYGTKEDTKVNKIDKSETYTIISRTGFGLVQELVHHINKDIKIYFEGGYNSYSFMNQTVYSIFNLKEKKYDKITVDEIKNFESIYELESFAKESKNQDYLNIIKFINKYGDNIFEINKKIKEKLVEDKSLANIIFTTTHKAKGLEYNQVFMTKDFIEKKEINNPDTKMSDTKINEELNIYYVAATRARKAICLG